MPNCPSRLSDTRLQSIDPPLIFFLSAEQSGPAWVGGWSQTLSIADPERASGD
jgi:hypothetical protein